MGVMESFMRALRLIFGLRENGKVQAAAEGIDFGRAVEAVEAEISGEERRFGEFAAGKSAEMRHLILQLSRSADSLEAHEISLDDGNKRFRQIVVTSQKNLCRQLRGISQKISPPQDVSFERMREYVPRAMRVLNSDLMPYWKNIALAKLMLKDEIRSIGDNMQEISGALNELNSGIFSERLGKLYSMRELAGKAGASMAQHEAASAQIDALKAVISSKEHEVSALRAKKALLTGSNEARRLRELESRKQALESEKREIISGFNSEIAPLEKVLKRLHAFAEHGDYLSPKEREVLSLLLTSSFSAFSSDPNGLNCKALLEKAERLVKDGSISLKEGERERRLAAMSSLLSKDFFSDYFWRVNKVQAEANLLEREASQLDVHGKLEGLGREADAVGRELKEATENLARVSNGTSLSRSDAAKREFAAMFNMFFAGRLSVRPENAAPEK